MLVKAADVNVIYGATIALCPPSAVFVWLYLDVSAFSATATCTAAPDALRVFRPVAPASDDLQHV